MSVQGLVFITSTLLPFIWVIRISFMTLFRISWPYLELYKNSSALNDLVVKRVIFQSKLILMQKHSRQSADDGLFSLRLQLNAFMIKVRFCLLSPNHAKTSKPIQLKIRRSVSDIPGSNYVCRPISVSILNTTLRWCRLE